MPSGIPLAWLEGLLSIVDLVGWADFQALVGAALLYEKAALGKSGRLKTPPSRSAENARLFQLEVPCLR